MDRFLAMKDLACLSRSSKDQDQKVTLRLSKNDQELRTRFETFRSWPASVNSRQG